MKTIKLILKNRLNFLFFSIFSLTLLSQLPNLRENSFAQSILFLWFLPVFIFFRKNFFISRIFKPFLIFYILWVVFLLFINFFNYNYFDFGLIRSFSLVIFIYMIGYAFSFVMQKEVFIKLISISCFILVPLLAIVIYNTQLTDYDIEDRIYAYNGKNSASQIIATGFIIIVAFIKNKGILLYLKILVLAFLLFVLFYLKSRGTIIPFVIFPIILIFFTKGNNKTKKIFFALLVLLILSIVIFFKEYVFFFENVILAGRDADSIDSIASGRFTQYNRFEVFFLNPFVGLGKEAPFIESFYLVNLVQFGVIGSFFVFLALLQPIHFYQKYCNGTDRLELVFAILIGLYYINGFFEAVAPFGPGVKCFMLWLFFGYLVGIKSNTKKNISLKQ